MFFSKRLIAVNFWLGLFLFSCNDDTKTAQKTCGDADEVAIKASSQAILNENSLVKVKDLCSDFFKKNPHGCLVKDQNGKLLPMTSYSDNFQARCLTPHCQDLTEAEHIQKLDAIVAETDQDKRSALCKEFRAKNPLYCLYERKDGSGNTIIGPSSIPTDWDKYCGN